MPGPATGHPRRDEGGHRPAHAPFERRPAETAGGRSDDPDRARVLPHGVWPSRIPIDRVAASGLRLDEIAAADGVTWWVEGRPREGGRGVLVRRDPDGRLTRLTPTGFSIRSRIHEYGGRAAAVDGLAAVVSDGETGRLFRVLGPGRLAPLTPPGARRYADIAIDHPRERLVAVREDLEPATLERHGEPEAALVAIGLDGGEPAVLVSGADFYAAPRLSPDGRELAWLEWDHPDMPWDGTRLRVARLDATGGLLPDPIRTVAGGPGHWISQPRWSPDGRLHYVAEPDGWMNVFRWDGRRATNLGPLPVEFAGPDWGPGQSTYGFASDGAVIAAGRSEGRTRLYRLDPRGADAAEIPLPYTEMTALAVDGERVVLRAGSPALPGSIVEVDLAAGTSRVLRRSAAGRLPASLVSTGRHVSFPTTGGEIAHGYFYPPRNPGIRGPGGAPPLVVTAHGGPVGCATSELSLPIQVLTSRGLAVLDVDFRGSTGYGRDYRRRLEGGWGVVDVDDCVAGARRLAAEGLVDPGRMVIRGKSSAGFLALAAVTFFDFFRAAVSYYGFADLEALPATSPKLEAHTHERLIGPWPGERERYRERSPIHHLDRIGVPVLVLQGADDPIVPVDAAERIVAALAARGLPHAFLAFDGEGHGFRRGETLCRAMAAELSFYAQVLGFTLADPVPVLDLGGGPPKAPTPAASPVVRSGEDRIPRGDR